MSETEALFGVLRQSADPDCAAAIEQLVRDGVRSRPLPHQCARLRRPSAASTKSGPIAAFLHAARLGLFELSWNVLCPGCGGVLDAGATLKTVNRDEYDCGLCAAGYKPTLDEMVEVTFTVSPRVRRIAAHDPGHAVGGRILPADFLEFRRRSSRDAGRNSLAEFTVDSIELPPGEKAVLSVQLPQRVRHRVRSGDARHAVHRRQGRADARAANALDGVQQGEGADRHDRDAAGAVAARRSRIAPTAACCRGCGSPATRCTICSASAGRS